MKGSFSVVSPTGIPEISNSLVKFLLNEKIVLQLDPSQVYVLSLLDLSGKVVCQQEVGFLTHHEIDVFNLPIGTYCLNILSNERKTFKFVKTDF